ncbi:MAG: SIS domain-containing protein [Pseudomonadota bacterium]
MRFSDLTLAALAASYDREHMNRVMDRFPHQITRALEVGLPALPRGPFERVVVAGMGGSALPVDVLVDAFEERLRVPVTVCRHYRLPHGVDERTLVIGSSFSGGTEEVIEAMASLPAGAHNAVVLTADKGNGPSPLVRLAGERGLPAVLIPAHEEPAGFQPRSAVGYFVSFLARILAATGAMPDPTADLQRVSAFLTALDMAPDAERIARWLSDRIPIVYTDERHLQSVARIAKIKFNENSKRPAFFNSFPESNHNEMIGFTRPMAEFGVLYLHDPDSHPRIPRRYEVMKQAFAHDGMANVQFERWEMPGSDRLERLFAAMVFAERCSYDLALLDGIDPTPVKLVETFKGLLG